MYCFRMSLLWFAWTSTREFGIEKLREATDGFRENSLIEGSLYKGFINGDVFAIQKMKWNACEELKILHKRSRTSQAIRCDPRYQRQRLHSKIYRRELVDLRRETWWEFLNTLFSVSEAVVYIQTVDRLDDGTI
ncbi:hypothetical protein ACFX13_041058 [Malus domestica]